MINLALYSILFLATKIKINFPEVIIKSLLLRNLWWVLITLYRKSDTYLGHSALHFLTVPLFWPHFPLFPFLYTTAQTMEPPAFIFKHVHPFPSQYHHSDYLSLRICSALPLHTLISPQPLAPMQKSFQILPAQKSSLSTTWPVQTLSVTI